MCDKCDFVIESTATANYGMSVYIKYHNYNVGLFSVNYLFVRKV